MRNAKKQLLISLIVGLFCLAGCSKKTEIINMPTSEPISIYYTATLPSPTQEETMTATLEASAVPTIEADKYTIDMEKFMRAAPSYEYMVSHPEEFQEAPDLLRDVEVFKDWYYNQYVPALLLGHEEKMTDMAGNKFSKRNVTNVDIRGGGHNGDGNYSFVGNGSEFTHPPTSEIPIVYFMHDGVLYPILAFTVNLGGGQLGNAGTYSIILHPERLYSDGFAAIERLYNGGRIQEITAETNVGEGTEDTELVREFLNDGFNWQADLLRVGPFFNIGLGKMLLVK